MKKKIKKYIHKQVGKTLKGLFFDEPIEEENPPDLDKDRTQIKSLEKLLKDLDRTKKFVSENYHDTFRGFGSSKKQDNFYLISNQLSVLQEKYTDEIKQLKDKHNCL